MIYERRVHAGQIYARHVAGDAILRGGRTNLTRVVLRGFLRARRHVAREALVVIRSGIMVERLVRVMTSYTGEARIPVAPATALLQPIGLKAHSLHALRSRLKDVVGSTVARPAEIHLRYGPQAPGIENGLAALGILLVVHKRGMLRAGPMTSFAIHSKDKVSGIESRPRRGSRRVTPKATAHRVRIQSLAQRLLQSWRRPGRMARRQVQALQALEEAHPAFVESPIPLENVGLALVSQSKGPSKRLRNGVRSVAYGIGSRAALFRDRKRVRPGLLPGLVPSLVKDPFVFAKRGRIGRHTRSPRHGRFKLCGHNLGMASRAFFGTSKIIQRGGLLRRPPARHLQPLVGGHGSFYLPLGRRIGCGGFLKRGERHRQRHGKDEKQR